MNSYNRISAFMDGALSLIICFFACFYAFGIFDASQPVLTLASIACAFSLSSLWLTFLSARRGKRKKDYSAYKDFFIYKSNKQNARFIFNALSTRYVCRMRGNIILAGDKQIFVLIRLNALSCQEMIRLALSIKRSTLIITNCVESGAIEHASKITSLLSVITLQPLMEWLDALHALPPVSQKPPIRQRLTSLLRAFIQPQNAKRLFSCGIVVLSFCFLTGFKIYYLIFAAALFLTSATIKLYQLIFAKIRS